MAATVAALAAGCTGGSEPGARRSGPPPASPSEGSPQPPPAGEVDGFVLSSSFEQPVCGVWWRPDPGCEFGVEGEVESGAFGCRTGEMCIRLQRMNREMHVGILAPAPAPAGRAFIGAAHRVPEVPAEAIPERPGYLELMQMTPTDGALSGWPVEVRLYPDRRLGLALAQGRTPGGTVAMTEWAAPVDEWFYVVVEISNGDPATQRMWVFGPDDRLVERVSLPLTTSVEWTHGMRTAQKVGGRTSTEVPMLTYADDWYVAEEFHGPLHIDADGTPLAA
jgi:hypothetical protein